MIKGSCWELIERSGELVEALEAQLAALKKEAVEARQRCKTAQEHGLGPYLLASDILPNLTNPISLIEGLAKRALEQIESATVEGEET